MAAVCSPSTVLLAGARCARFGAMSAKLLREAPSHRGGKSRTEVDTCYGQEHGQLLNAAVDEAPAGTKSGGAIELSSPLPFSSSRELHPRQSGALVRARARCRSTARDFIFSGRQKGLDATHRRSHTATHTVHTSHFPFPVGQPTPRLGPKFQPTSAQAP